MQPLEAADLQSRQSIAEKATEKMRLTMVLDDQHMEIFDSIGLIASTSYLLQVLIAYLQNC
jgi:hypothetical protein